MSGPHDERKPEDDRGEGARGGDWIWDRSGAVDPEVEALEALLRPLGLDESRLATPPGPGAVETRRPRIRRAGGLSSRSWLAAAVLLLSVGLYALLAWTGEGRPQFGPDEFVALVVDDERTPRLRLESGRPHRVGEGRTLVLLGSQRSGFRIELSFAPGSEISLERADPEGASRFALRAGSVEASVDPELPAGVLEIETPYGICVDLGCRYRLSVDPGEDGAELGVLVGRVAFEDGARRVLIPAGAAVRARSDSGIGTPAFEDLAPPLTEVLRRLDSLQPDDPARADLAEKFAAASDQPHDTLPLWHLMQDEDPRIQKYALGGLRRIAGYPKTKMLLDPDVWLEHLEPLW